MCINSFAWSKNKKSQYLQPKHKKSWWSILDQDCRSISRPINHCLDIQIKRFRWTKNKIIFNQWIKHGQSKQKKQNFVRLPETWCVPQICGHTIVRCVLDLLHPNTLFIFWYILMYFLLHVYVFIDVFFEIFILCYFYCFNCLVYCIIVFFFLFKSFSCELYYYMLLHFYFFIFCKCINLLYFFIFVFLFIFLYFVFCSFVD